MSSGCYFLATTISILLEFPKCDEIKVNVEGNQALDCQKNVKDFLSKKNSPWKIFTWNKGDWKSTCYFVIPKKWFPRCFRFVYLIYFLCVNKNVMNICSLWMKHVSVNFKIIHFSGTPFMWCSVHQIIFLYRIHSNHINKQSNDSDETIISQSTKARVHWNCEYRHALYTANLKAESTTEKSTVRG